MKKPQKFCVKLSLALAACCLFLAEPAFSENQALLQKLAAFSQRAIHPTQCLLVPSAAEKNISLYKRAKTSSKVVDTAEAGSSCRILHTKQNRQEETWFKIEVASHADKKKFVAFAPHSHILTKDNLYALQEKEFLLVFPNSCEKLPCPANATLVTSQEKRHLHLGDGSIAIDRKGKNIFFGRMARKTEESGKAYWESTLFRYNIPGNLLTAMGNGISPKTHPEKDWVIYRNLLGHVLVADYSGKLSRIIYKPDENVRLYQDPSGKLAPPPKRSYRSSNEGVIPPPVAFYRDPTLNEIPAAVEFTGKDQIQFQVPYDQGRIQKTVQLSLQPKLF